MSELRFRPGRESAHGAECRVGPEPRDPTGPPVLIPQTEIVAMVRKLREHVAQNSEYVGPRFAEEARKIHHEEAEARGIHGEASDQDVKLLKEEGVEFYPLPDPAGRA